MVWDRYKASIEIFEANGISIASPLAHDAGFVSLDGLVERMENKEFDIIAAGRASLAEPEWPNKVRDGRISDIAPDTKEVLKELA